MRRRHLPRVRNFLVCILAVACSSTASCPRLASKSPSEDFGTVWVIPSMYRVGESDPAGAESTIVLQAARGECASFQIVMRAPSGGSARISASDLSGANGKTIGAGSYEFFREGYVNVNRPSFDYGSGNRPLGSGWYADPLFPLDSGAVEIPSGKNQPVWVDLFVPTSAPPGAYEGTVDVAGEKIAGRVNVKLTVWNFTLPSRPSLRSSFGVHGPRMTDTATHELLLRHKLMPATVVPRESSGLASRLGLNISGLWFSSGANPKNCTILPAPSLNALRRAVAYYPAGLDVYVYVADEIDRCVNLRDRVKEWARVAHAAGAKTLATLTPVPELYDSGPDSPRPAIDIWVLLAGMHESAPDRVADALARGMEIWSYTALAQESYSPKWAIDYAPANYRIQPGFLNQSLGYKGLLYWSVDQWTADPFRDVTSYSEGSYAFPGEGMLVYPGPQGERSGTTPSMRLKWLRAGVDDFEYVEILKGLGRGNWAIETIRAVARDWKNWASDPACIDAVRRKLGEEIDRLQSGKGTDR